MFSGGDYEEVRRWLWNFVTSHAKREDVRVEAVIEADGPREDVSYGVRLRLGERVQPPGDVPPLELAYADVARERGNLAWASALAERVRALAREVAREAPTRQRQA